MMFIILTLIVLVAAMNVVASFTMLVRVKRGSIAILRTMGAGKGTIVRAFFLSAAAVGIVGTAARHRARAAGLRQHGVDRSTCVGRPKGGWMELEFITSAPARVRAGRGADRDRHRHRPVARGGGLSRLAQHAGRTGRRIAP